MTWDRRKLVLAVVFLGAVVALALTLGRGSSTGSAAKAGLAKKNASAIGRIRESSREAQIAEGVNVDPDSAAGEELAARAYPSNEVTFSERQAAITAGAKVAKRKAKHQDAWQSLGPNTLERRPPRNADLPAPTQWSGRVTALAVGPKCNANECTLYVGAAGGGVWRSKNALAKKPTGSSSPTTSRRTRSARSRSTRTIRRARRSTSARARRTGAATASPASASIKTTDDGAHWCTARRIARRSRQPLDRRRRGRSDQRESHPHRHPHRKPRGRLERRLDGAHRPRHGDLPVERRRRDVHADAHARRNRVRGEVRPDESERRLRRIRRRRPVALERRRHDVGADLRGHRSRYSFSPVKLPNGKTRIYLSDANGGGQSSQAYRVDDAGQPAATLTASNNAAWTRLSSPTPGTPGLASWGYCDGQCSYDMAILSPADRPDMVVLSGLMNYDELPPYAGPGGQRSEWPLGPALDRRGRHLDRSDR